MSFIIIGENVHTTRVIRRGDRRVGSDERGREAIAFVDERGAERRLPVSPAEQATMEYEEGRIKHVRTAVRLAMEEGDDAEVAVAYLRALAHHQVAAGAAFLDVNVDEVSLKLAEQKRGDGMARGAALAGRRGAAVDRFLQPRDHRGRHRRRRPPRRAADAQLGVARASRGARARRRDRRRRS